MSAAAADGPKTYTNPVYPHSFPDPFVLKFRGEYFAYATGYAPDGNVCEILHSPDLVDWRGIGSAMPPLSPSPPFYWAPEVTYDNGKFYLYYSTGNETFMEIRVAVSDRPDRGFIDSGRRLTHEEFAIDAHVFIDDDGARYLFYATDFLEHTHIGTGTVVDRMIDPFTLEGKPQPVTRARYDWQVYDPARKEKGGVRWHTVEGPAVLKRKGKYFEMFSGGNWQNTTYGVSFAVSETIDRPGEWEQFSDGKRILPILRTIPDLVIGPGHNSVVRGPNNRELYCVYHRWTNAGRVLSIDRMDLVGDRIIVAGPTTTEQPAPFRPANMLDLAETSIDGWIVREDRTLRSGTSLCEISATPGDSFVCECTFRFTEWKSGSRFGVELESSETSREFALLPDEACMFVKGDGETSQIPFPYDLEWSVDHLLRFEALPGRCVIQIDNRGMTHGTELPGVPRELRLFAENADLEISAAELTRGFEETFEHTDVVPAQFALEGGSGRIADNILILEATPDVRVAAVFRQPYSEFEIAANLAARDENIGDYGIVLLTYSGSEAVSLLVSPADRRLKLIGDGTKTESDLDDFFDARDFHQLRFVSKEARILAYIDGSLVGTTPATSSISQCAIFSHSKIAVDMVRLTAI